MKCPICKKEVSPDNEFAPFCSDRCKLIDLGNWASGKYVIPGPPSRLDENANEDEDDDAQPHR